VSWTDVSVKGCQGGARCEGVSCEVSVCEMVSRRSGCRSRSSLNGVGAYKACHRRTMSPCPVMGGSCQGCISCGSSRLKRPSVCVRSCRSMACWNKTKVHVAGVPLSSVATDCRLRHSIVGCDDVWVYGKQKTQFVLSGLRVNERRVSRMSYGSSSPVGVEARRKSPCSWSRRRSKLTWCTTGVAGVVGMGKVSKLCG